MTTFNACDGPEPTKPPEDDNRLLKIKKLKAKLINEEHRLVLMKKIRQSQTRPIQQQQPNNNSNNTSSGGLNSSAHAGQLKKLRLPQSGPLSLQKNSSSAASSASYHGSASLASTPNPTTPSSSSMNQTPAHAHQRPKVNTLWNPPQQARHPTPVGIAPPHVGNLSRQPITTPPNVVMMGGNLAGQQSLLMNQMGGNARSSSAGRSQQQSFNSSGGKSSQAAQLLMQKRSAFKPSIQKQLEQTLMQQQSQQKHGQSGLGFSSSSSNKRAIGITSPHVGNLSRNPITTPPNVVQDMRGTGAGLSGQQSLLMNASSLAAAARGSRPQQSQQLQQQTSFNKSQAAQMLLQKRTAAKNAIHKQLEQTLMQLQTQKHLQLGIDFIPNANNIEFVYYIGLEACVDYLTDTKNPLDTQPLEKPFECSTCGTDFTPNWSWKRSNAVCENCVTNHVKKSIKNSQASRIKSVLAKAAKQEQDMDARIMAEAATVVSSPSTTTSQQHSLLQPVSHHQQQQQQQQRSNPQQMWSRMNGSPMTTLNSNRSPSVQPPQPPPPQTAPVAANPLAAGLQPAALASLLQMNPQLSTLASLMTANNNTNTNTNQFAQVAALLMNQLTMNLWKR